MDKLNGYALLVIASRKRKPETVVWHYSTGNDDSVCGKGAGADGTGYIDVDDAPKYKGCCSLCARYVGTHGDYQGWDSENGVRYLSITNPKPEPVANAFCAMHGEYISQCADRHNSEDDGGFMETVDVPSVVTRVKGFPKSTPQDTEDHFMGSGFDQWGWWEGMSFNYKHNEAGEMVGWEYTGIPGYEEDADDFMSPITIDHAAILKAIRKIAAMNSLVPPAERLYLAGCVIQECKTWVFRGPGECDFDAPMADEVMQMAAFGRVIYA